MGVEKRLTEKFQRLFANTSSLEEKRDGFCARVPSLAFPEGPAWRGNTAKQVKNEENDGGKNGRSRTRDIARDALTFATELQLLLFLLPG